MTTRPRFGIGLVFMNFKVQIVDKPEIFDPSTTASEALFVMMSPSMLFGSKDEIVEDVATPINEDVVADKLAVEALKGSLDKGFQIFVIEKV